MLGLAYRRQEPPDVETAGADEATGAEAAGVTVAVDVSSLAVDETVVVVTVADFATEVWSGTLFEPTARPATAAEAPTETAATVRVIRRTRRRLRSRSLTRPAVIGALPRERARAAGTS
jgi:hypothetical protein